MITRDDCNVNTHIDSRCRPDGWRHSRAGCDKRRKTQTASEDQKIFAHPFWFCISTEIDPHRSKILVSLQVSAIWKQNMGLQWTVQECALCSAICLPILHCVTRHSQPVLRISLSFIVSLESWALLLKSREYLRLRPLFKSPEKLCGQNCLKQYELSLIHVCHYHS